MATEVHPRVLVVDDEQDMLDMLRLVLKKGCSCDIVTARSGKETLALLEKGTHPDVVLSDIMMPDMDGLALLKKIREQDASISVVLMTGYGTVDMAVEALKNGAYDFLQKPFDNDEMIRAVHKGLERTALLRTNQNLQDQIRSLSLSDGFIGQSPALKAATDLIAKIADTDATVLIRGESGTGKEVAARALHELSSRSDRRMIVVNCPALPEQVLESELFGYSRGAFTGALKSKKGLFLEAEGSTILLDEVADIPISVQTKLLRVLQEKEIQPLGQNKTIKVNVRVVASTNQDLEAKIRSGEFREDLFYRLNVITITMPNLQQMREDLPLLVQHFLEHFKKRYDRPLLTLSRELLQQLYQRPWPGNVRELRNTLKRIVLLADADRVEYGDEPSWLDQVVQPQSNGKGDYCSEEEGGLRPENSDRGPHPDGQFREGRRCPWDIRAYYGITYNEAKASLLAAFTSGYLTNLLTEHQGNVTKAAAASAMERQALQRLMRKFHLLSTNFK